MDNDTSVKGIIQRLIPDGPVIIEGIVIKTEPLNIQLINDNKMVLGPGVLIIPKHMTDYEAEVNIEPVELNQESGAISLIGYKMTVFNGLKEGERVLLLSLNNGKKYYILDRAVS